MNILSFTAGVGFAWTSPAIPKMNDPVESPLPFPMSHDEESWLASLYALGACFGPFAFGYLSDKIGRKKTLLSCAIPVAACYIIKAFANDMAYFYMARLLGGFGVAAVFTVTPMYIGEIAEDANRGALGCVMPVFLTIGILFAYCVGPFLSIMWFGLINVIPVLIFLVLTGLFVPNSPYFLIAQNKKSQAEISLRVFRGRPSLVDVDKEMTMIVDTVRESLTHSNKFRDIFLNKGTRKGICITFGLMFFQQFSGISVLLAYMQSVFEAADTHLTPEVSTIIIGFVQFFACATTPAVVDRLGRRVLLLASTLGTAISNIAMGIFFYMKLNDYEVHSVTWLPIASLVLFMICYNLGIGPLPWAILGELFPPNIKAKAATLTTSVCLFMAFFTNAAFPYVKIYVGMAETFWFFGICGAVGLVFVYALVPETKGKSLHDIIVMMNK